MTLEKKTTLEADAIAALVEQFRRKANLEALVAVFGAQAQDLENVNFELVDNRTIDAAEGPQLDGIGSIVGESRDGRTDTVYREAIRVKILINDSSGTAENIIEIVSLMVDIGTTIEVSESHPEDPAHFEVDLDPEITADGFRISRAIFSARPVGVRHILTWFISSTPFRFDSGPGFDLGQYAQSIDF
jgi:hypothetical protein